MKCSYLCIMFALLSFGAFSQIDTNIFSKQNSLLYAQFLSQSGKNIAAAHEYARILAFESNNDSLRLATIAEYRKAGIYDTAIFYINGYELNHILFQKEAILLYLLSRNFDELGRFLKLCTLETHEKEIAVLHAFMLKGEWKSAEKQLEYVQIPTMERIIAYNKLVEKGKKSPHRNMALAVGMSALVPGLGRVYAGAPWEGLSTFIINGFLAFSAYRGFSQKEYESIPGWGYGAAFAGFYAANIYGTVKQVKKFNKKQADKLANEVEHLILNDF